MQNYFEPHHLFLIQQLHVLQFKKREIYLSCHLIIDITNNQSSMYGRIRQRQIKATSNEVKNRQQYFLKF